MKFRANNRCTSSALMEIASTTHSVTGHIRHLSATTFVLDASSPVAHNFTNGHRTWLLFAARLAAPESNGNEETTRRGKLARYRMPELKFQSKPNWNKSRGTNNSPWAPLSQYQSQSFQVFSWISVNSAVASTTAVVVVDFENCYCQETNESSFLVFPVVLCLTKNVWRIVLDKCHRAPLKCLGNFVVLVKSFTKLKCCRLICAVTGSHVILTLWLLLGALGHAWDLWKIIMFSDYHSDYSIRWRAQGDVRWVQLNAQYPLNEWFQNGEKWTNRV